MIMADEYVKPDEWIQAPDSIKPDWIKPAWLKPGWISDHTPEALLGSHLFQFNVRFVDNTVVKVNMANDIEIEYERLEEQIDQVPGQYVWWASVYSEAKATVTMLERRIKIRRGELVDAALQEARQHNVKLTDKQALTVVERDTTLNEWEVKLALIQRNVGKLWHMLKAIEMKSELLRSRSGFKKQERDQQQR